MELNSNMNSEIHLLDSKPKWFGFFLSGSNWSLSGSDWLSSGSKMVRASFEWSRTGLDVVSSGPKMVRTGC